MDRFFKFNWIACIAFLEYEMHIINTGCTVDWAQNKSK